MAEGSGTPKSRGSGSGNPKASRGAKTAGSYGRGRPASGGAGQDRRRSGVGGGARQAGRPAATDGARQPGQSGRSPAARSPRAPAADGVRRGATRDQGRRGPSSSARTGDETRGTTRPTAGDGPRRTSRTAASGEYRSNRSPAGGEYRGRSPASEDGVSRPSPRPAPGEGARGRTSPGGRPGRPAAGGLRRDTAAGSDFRGARRPADTGSRRTTPGDARRRPRPADEGSSSARDGGRDRTSGPARSSARDGRPGDNRAGTRDGRPGDNRAGARDQARPSGGRPDETPGRGHSPGYQVGPQVPDSVSADQLDPQARSQLTSLPNDLADSVARHLVAADLDEDPERGYTYAQAAKRLAARVGVVREACGIAAYRTGRWAEALSELRAARRMTGRDDYLPIMADCERALGRLDRALALVREAKASELERATHIELRIVESGIRRDQGLPAAAVIALQGPELTSGRPPALVRADLLRLCGRVAGGRPRGRGTRLVRSRGRGRYQRRDRRGRAPGRAGRHRIRGPRRRS